MPEHTGFLAALLHYRFLQQALIAGLLVGAACSALSTYVVLRRMAFIGQGISHAAFGGVALGLYLFGNSPSADTALSITTAIFCIAVALAIGAITRRREISADSAIGIFFAAAMALGIVLVSLRRQYTADVITYLFGSILAVSPADLVAIAILAAIVGICIIGFYKELLYYTFDERMAAASGLPVAFLHYLLVTLLALTVVVSIKVVGIVLVSAFLVIPGATAKLLASSFRQMMLLSLLIGVACALAGLAISFYARLPSGATIVLTQFAVFAIIATAAGRRT